MTIYHKFNRTMGFSPLDIGWNIRKRLKHLCGMEAVGMVLALIVVGAIKTSAGTESR